MQVFGLPGYIRLKDASYMKLRDASYMKLRTVSNFWRSSVSCVKLIDQNFGDCARAKLIENFWRSLTRAKLKNINKTLTKILSFYLRILSIDHVNILKHVSIFCLHIGHKLSAFMTPLEQPSHIDKCLQGMLSITFLFSKQITHAFGSSSSS